MANIYEDGDYRKPNAPVVNPLLVRPPLGKTRATTYDLPSERFIYGKRQDVDNEGVREAISDWIPHHASPPATVHPHRSTLDKSGKTVNELKSMTFGMPSRPSTPIYSVLTNSYQRSSIEQRKQEKIVEQVEKKIVKTQQLRTAHTKASLGHCKVNPKPFPPEATVISSLGVERFTMKRFQNISGKTITLGPREKAEEEEKTN